MRDFLALAARNPPGWRLVRWLGGAPPAHLDPTLPWQTHRVPSLPRGGGWGPSGFPIDDEAFGYLKRVIVTPAVYPSLVGFRHFNIQSTGQKSRFVYTLWHQQIAMF